MRPLKLTPASDLSAHARAAELTSILGRAIARSHAEESSETDALGLGFLPRQSVHTTPLKTEKTHE